MTDTSKGRIIFLDYMRIFAFVSVIIGHQFFLEINYASIDQSYHVSIRNIAEALIPITLGGAAGVLVFFLTSGYIISHVLQREIPHEFLIRRVFRIYPLYIFAILAQIATDHYIGGIPLPPASVWIPRALLIGDFFDVPNALAGVEWTLRVEIMFYALMATLKHSHIIDRPKYLPTVYLLISLALFYASPFPNAPGLSTDYFNLYFPFLLIGSCIYLAERNLASTNNCIFVSLAIIYLFLVSIPSTQPNWKESNYALLAVAIFVISWMFRHHFKDGRLISLLSNMTYSVYLFHNWMWPYLTSAVETAGFQIAPVKLQVLALTLIICYALHATIEKFGLQVGRSAIEASREALSAIKGKRLRSAASQ